MCEHLSTIKLCGWCVQILLGRMNSVLEEKYLRQSYIGIHLPSKCSFPSFSPFLRQLQSKSCVKRVKRIEKVRLKVRMHVLWCFEKYFPPKKISGVFKVDYLDSETDSRKTKPYDRKTIISKCQISIFTSITIFINPNECFW